MKHLWIGALLVGSLISFEANAQERAGDAALGAVSGAVVLGPVGAVAGAFIGYTAGPSISRSWGVRRSASRARVQRTAQTNPAPDPQTTSRARQTTGQASSPPPARSPEPRCRVTLACRRFRVLNRSSEGNKFGVFDKIDTSGKSPAYVHHRKN